MDTPAGPELVPAPRPRVCVDELLAAKGTPVITSVDDLAADTFSTTEELEEFLAFNRAERRRNMP
jgi:hypothetical protein